MSEFRLDLDNNAIFQEYLKDNYFIEGDINTANTVYIYFSSNALYYPNTLECFDTKIVKNNRYEWTRRCVTGNNIANIYVRDYIYFSSNALYYPNTLECFDTKIVKNNRYEWTRRCVTGNNIANIYVRDLFKQWCVVGINSNLNSLDKVADFLKSLVKHKKVITVGSSAGGYLATVFGILLDADVVFNFSGQFVLTEDVINEYSLLTKYKNDKTRSKYYLATVFGILLDADVVFNFSGQFVLTEDVINEYSLLTKYKNDKTRSKYYSLLPLIENSTVQIYYFYPAYNKADCIQKQYVENFTNVHCFGFNTSNHGVPIYPSN